MNVFKSTAALLAVLVAGAAIAAASPDASTDPITDAVGHQWRINDAAQVLDNGVHAGNSANAALLVYSKGQVYHENKSSQWFVAGGKNGWTQVAGDPRVGSSSSSSSGGASSSSSSSSGASSSSSSSSGSSTSSSSGVSPLASKAALLNYITALPSQPGKHVIIGQHAEYWGTPMATPNAVKTQTGKDVGMLATAVGIVGSTEDFVGDSNAWIAKGGIVLASLWPNNPQTGIDDNVRLTSPSDIYTSGKALNTKWNTYLDNTIAPKLKALKGPVLFRPFVEIDGNWSWWDGLPTDVFVKLYQYTWTRLTGDGVTNVLWVFNVNNYSGNYTQYYPGTTYVDVVSEDAYPPVAGDPTYTALMTLGKPFFIAESGVETPNNNDVATFSGDNSKLLATVKASFPKAFAVAIWCQHWGIPFQNGASAMMNDPAAITLGDLPTH